MKTRSISVFMPVYNEEKIIDDAIAETVRVVDSITDDYEILLIDDGSTDASGAKILKWVEKNNKIKLIKHETNLGYGSALRAGFQNVQKDLVFYTDADMPVCLDEFKKVLPFMEEYDSVVGYRINRWDTPRRFIYSKIYNFLLRALLGVKIRDSNFSFKCIKRELLRKCNLSAKSVFIDGQLMAEIFRNCAKVKEVPLVYSPRKHGKSNFNSLKVAFSTLGELLSHWARAMRPKAKILREERARKKRMYYVSNADKLDSEAINYYELKKRLNITFNRMLTHDDLKGRLVLDAGAGTGWFSREAASKKANVISLDLGPELIRKTQEKCRCCGIAGSITALPFKNNSFKVVICSEVIEHTEDPYSAIKELCRVTAEGGTLILTSPNRLWQPVVSLASALRLRPYQGFENFVSYKKLTKWLVAHDMEIADCFGFNLLPFNIRFLHSTIDYMDRFKYLMRPLMINIAIKGIKRHKSLGVEVE